MTFEDTLAMATKQLQDYANRLVGDGLLVDAMHIEESNDMPPDDLMANESAFTKAKTSLAQMASFALFCGTVLGIAAGVEALVRW